MVRRAVSLAVLLGAGSLHAEPAPPLTLTTARLVYTRARGAEQCPDEPAVREAVRVRLGYDPFRADATRTVTATIAARRGGLRADVKLAGPKGAVAGSRQLDAAPDDCDELVAAMALAIAIAVDPESQLRPPPPPSPSIPPAPSAPEPIAPPPSPAPAPPPELPWMAPLPALLAPAASPSPPDDAPLRFRAGLAVVGAAGSAPHVTGGLAVAAGLRRRWLSAVVEARGDLPASTAATALGSVSATLFSFTLAPCFHWRWLVGCALGTAGRLRGVGSDVPNATSDVTSFGATGARLGGEVPLGAALALAFATDVTALLPRTSLQLHGRDVWTTAPVTGTLRVGLVGDFP
jgi:hypothetical protein